MYCVDDGWIGSDCKIENVGEQNAGQIMRCYDLEPIKGDAMI
jgi:hypothetical protein